MCTRCGARCAHELAERRAACWAAQSDPCRPGTPCLLSSCAMELGEANYVPVRRCVCRGQCLHGAVVVAVSPADARREARRSQRRERWDV